MTQRARHEWGTWLEVMNEESSRRRFPGFRSRNSLHLVRSIFFFGQERAEAIELAFPGGAMIADPLLEGAKAGWLDAAGSYAAQLFCVNQSSFFENLQMLRNRRERDAERF